MAALLEGFKALGVGRLVAMAAVAGAMLLMLAFLALRGGGGERMALLYADMDLREAGQVADQLDRAHIAHESGPDGTRISVPGVRGRPGPAAAGQGGPAVRRLDRLRDLRSRRRPDGEPVPAGDQPNAGSGGGAGAVHPDDCRCAGRAGASGAAEAGAVRAGPGGGPGERRADDGRCGPDGPGGGAVGAEPDRLGRAGAAAAEHRHHRQPRQPAGPRRGRQRPGRHRGRVAHRDRAAPVAQPSRTCWSARWVPGRVRAETAVEMDYDQVT